jgi:hypothetical protein
MENDHISKKEEDLHNQVNECQEQFLDATGNKIIQLFKLGASLCDLQIETKLKGKGWLKYLADNLPDIDQKRAQRAMRLSGKIDLSLCPGLAFLSQRKLLSLASLIDVKDIVKWLHERNIDYKFTAKDSRKCNDFQKAIDSILKEIRKPSKPNLSKRFLKSVGVVERLFGELSSSNNIQQQVYISELKKSEKQLSEVLYKLRNAIETNK